MTLFGDGGVAWRCGALPDGAPPGSTVEPGLRPGLWTPGREGAVTRSSTPKWKPEKRHPRSSRCSCRPHWPWAFNTCLLVPFQG